MGGQSSGTSSYKAMQKQAMAEEVERQRIARERAASVASANAEASGGVTKGGEGSGNYDGALTAARKKKGSTLAGEGEQTFGGSSSLGG